MKKRHTGLNHIYRLIWNETLNTWAAVSETTKGRSRRPSGRKLFAAWLALFPSALLAAPTGGNITLGNGTISQSGTQTTINQQSNKLSIDWNTFSVGAQESVRFNQPSSNAIALNRITSQSPSQIFGQLSANGQVFILNPNGVLFGQGAQVNVGGLVASTLNLSNADFASGNYSFNNNGHSGSIINQGILTANVSGYIALLAPEVSNQGIISARLGTALLGAGDTITLTLNNGSLLGYSIDKGSLQALADNRQLIQADGGQVFMGAKAADQLAKAVVNNTGIIEAHTVEEHSGTIKLIGDMQTGDLKVGGTLDASAPNGGNGGFIETSAAHVKIADDIKISTLAPQGITGQWLVDPQDFTIAATGGDISGITLSNQLANNNVTLSSTQGAVEGSGDLNVNDDISWNNSNSLILNAERDININGSIHSYNSGKLTLRSDLNGSGIGTVNFGNNSHLSSFDFYNINLYYNPTNYNTPNDYSNYINGSYTAWMLINSLNQLQMIRNNPGGNYALSKNIDAAITSTWNNGLGFLPIGSDNFLDTWGYANPYGGFTGKFDGLNHSISNLTINRPSTDYIGLFQTTGSSSEIKNLHLLNEYINGNNYTGGLAGYTHGHIENIHVNATISGNSNTGGIIGNNEGFITKSNATGQVLGNQNVGGLTGQGYGTISLSYSSNDVIGNSSVGGLTGTNTYLFDSYSTSNVSGNSAVGGLIGSNYGWIYRSYMNGKVNGQAGAIVGTNSGYVDSSVYWNMDNSGALSAINNNTFFATPSSPTGLSDTQIKQKSSFSNFDFDNIWRIYNDHTAPLLRSFLKPLTITGQNYSKTYDGQSWTGILNITSYSDISASNSSHLYNTNTTTPFNNYRNAGTYTPDNIWSDQQGYDISYAGASLIIHKAPTTLTGANAENKTYDGTTSATVNGGTLSGIISGDTVTINGGAFSDKNAGNDKTVTINLSGSDGGNYIQPTLTANINKATLNVNNAYAYDKTYNGTTWTYAGGDLTGHINGDYVYINGGQFNDKNAGFNKPVSLTLDGTDANNYSLNQPNLTANINKASLYIYPNIQDKVYDGTTTAQINSFYDYRANGDDLKITYNQANFEDKNVGYYYNYCCNKLVNITGIELSGQDANNYTVNSTITGYANITPATLNITVAAQNKVYDGTTTANVSFHDNRIEGDNLDISLMPYSIAYYNGTYSITSFDGKASFDNKNAGTGKTVTASGLVLSGMDADNYIFNTTATTTADIAKAPLTITATAQNKTYDGLTTATAILSDNRITGDILTLSNTAANFDNKNVGTGKTVTLSGITASGTDANNYDFSPSTNTTADITPRTLNITATAQNKTYDGNTSASVSLNDNRISGDSLTLNHAAANFDTANTGTAKTVTVSGISATGTDTDNYALANTASTTADITKAALTVTANDQSKTYNNIPYSGGNGVSYKGFVNNESASVLGGTLNYGGNSQGATTIGQYAITPQGLSANNYALAYVDGSLTIQPATSYEAAIQSVGTVASQSASDNTTTPDDTPNKSSSRPLPAAHISNSSNNSTPHLAKVIGCGIQLPSDAASISCN